MVTERGAAKVESLEAKVQRLEKEKKDLNQGVLSFILYKNKNISNDGGICTQIKLRLASRERVNHYIEC